MIHHGRSALSSADALPLEGTYLGGPTAVRSIAGVRFVGDPSFDAAGKEHALGAVRLRKLRGPALQSADVGSLGVALVSHVQHPHNLDDAGRAILHRIPRVLTTPSSASKLGGHATGMAPRGIASPRVAGWGVTPDLRDARPPWTGRRGEAHGQVTGFAISAVEPGEDLAYRTGDAVWFEGTAEVARRLQPRVVLLFAGAARTARGRST